MQHYALRLRLGYVHRLPELLERHEALGRLEDAQKVRGRQLGSSCDVQGALVHAS